MRHGRGPSLRDGTELQLNEFVVMVMATQRMLQENPADAKEVSQTYLIRIVFVVANANRYS